MATPSPQGARLFHDDSAIWELRRVCREESRAVEGLGALVLSAVNPELQHRLQALHARMTCDLRRLEALIGAD
jgi:hypothetical protein